MTSIYAFIEYDDMNYRNYPDFPIWEGGNEVIDFTEFQALANGKDYRFFAAIGGVRNEIDMAPLFPIRGLPSKIHGQIRRFMREYFEEDFPGASWLSYEEITAAMKHMALSYDDLSLAVQIVLGTMSLIVQKLGSDRVRLIFAFQ